MAGEAENVVNHKHISSEINPNEINARIELIAEARIGQNPRGEVTIYIYVWYF